MLNDLIGTKLISFGKVVEELRDGRGFMGFFGRAEPPHDQSGVARIGAQRAQRLGPSRVVGAP
jgi:hypothetical protein